MTHVNVSVSVTDDNKAVMYVALDRSGKLLMISKLFCRYDYSVRR